MKNDSLFKKKSKKDLYKRIAITVFILFAVRLITKVPVPFLNSTIANYTYSDQDALNLYNRLTGGGLETFSILSLSIGPYITASILFQLLSIIFPSLEKYQKDGEYGKKKVEKIIKIISFVLTTIQAFLISVSFSSFNIIIRGSLPILIVTMVLIAGTGILLWLGNKITEFGVGNGISLILLLNILSRIPKDINALYNQFVEDQGWMGLLNAFVILLVVLLVIVLTIYLNNSIRKIPIQYSRKLNGKYDDSANIPLKVNVGNVMPIIFASSILTLPSLLVMNFPDFPKDGFWHSMYAATQQSNWFILSSWKLTIGYFAYLALLMYFAYFYAEITFNPAEISYNLKRSGGSIPGVRIGDQTIDYLENISKNLILIGTILLGFVCTIPMVATGLFQMKATFFGTSIIIAVSILLETFNQIDINGR